DVGVLAARAADGLEEARDVRADLLVGDEALARLVHELDRVLDGEDVARAFAVDEVDHRGERGGLAAAGRPGDEDEARAQLGELADAGGGGERRQAEGFAPG